MADYNRQLADQNQQVNNAMAQRQYELGVQQNQYQDQVNAYQKQVNESQAQAQENNATTLSNYARSQEQQGMDQASRIQLEKARTLALQRGQYAASGVNAEGSPLAILADTATNYEMQTHDATYAADLKAKGLDQQATLMKYDAATTRNNNLFSSEANDYKNSVDSYTNELNYEASQAGSRIAIRQADLTQLSNLNTASGTSMAGYGTLLSGLSTMASTGVNYNYPSNRGTGARYTG